MSGEQPIRRIAPVAPVPSILTSARPLPDTEWRDGVAWNPACVVSQNFPWCPAPGQAKTTAGLDGVVATKAFMIYTPLECDWTTVESGAALEEAATQLTDAHTAWGIARALWLGDGLPDVDEQPTLRRSAVDVTVGGVMDLDDAVAALLSAYEQCSGGSGGAVLHVPGVLVPGALGGIAGGGRVAWPEGQFYRAALGAVLSPGPGYPAGASADGVDGFGPKTGGSDAATTYQGNALDEVWVYITGPVEFAVGPIDPMSLTPDATRTNRTEVIAERPAIVRFDPCCVFAALVRNTAGLVS